MKNPLAAHQKYPVEEIQNKVFGKPLVSVCVQTYQHEETIARCLDGILMQRVDFPMEILLSEDESSDGTREICMQYARDYPDRIRLFLHRRENNIWVNGRPSGRFGFLYNLMQSNGQYLAICEGDDYWTDPQKIQKQINAMNRHPQILISFHPAVEVVGGKEQQKKVICNHADNKCVFDLNEVILGSGSFMPTASLVFRREAVDLLPPWIDQAPVADTFIQVYASSRGGALYIPEIMSVYNRFLPGSWTDVNVKNSDSCSLFEGYVTCYEKMIDDFPDNRKMIAFKVAYFSKLLQILKKQQTDGEKSGA
jgi:glycosyltransferase involved in cell wall biosynthesis